MELRKNEIHIADARKGKAVMYIVFPLEDEHLSGTYPITSPEGRSAKRAHVKPSYNPVHRVLPAVANKSQRHVLVIRSGSSLQACLRKLLGRRCLIRAYSGKQSTLLITERCGPSLVLSSIVVPRVKKSRLYTSIGSSVRASRVPIVLLATLKSRGSVLRKLRGKTSTCVAGPFDVGILETGVEGVLTGQTLLEQTCTNLRSKIKRIPPSYRGAQS